MRWTQPVPNVGWSTDAGQEYEMVGEDKLPSHPTPVVISDKRGRAKWTISIPQNYDFPLKPDVYSEICLQTREVSMHVSDLHSHMHREHAAHFGYYHVDPNFMDVAEASEHGLLPAASSRLPSNKRKGKQGSMVGVDEEQLANAPVCEKSMTYVLESSDAGMGRMMIALWSAYGLAQKEERAFFIDDSRWAYGNYTSLFQPPPVPSCRPPPRNEILPCPHHARHLLVSEATFHWTFGGAYEDEFEDARKMEVFRQKPMFDFARLGYEKLFKMRSDDAEYVEGRIHELMRKTVPGTIDQQRGKIVGLHVRHGDRHPHEFQYSDSYIPLNRYLDTANDMLDQAFNTTTFEGHSDTPARQQSFLILASDDPEVYESEELSRTMRAQEQIKLASQQALNAHSPASSKNHDMIRDFVEETVGWEGGFFAGMFWSLGKGSTNSAGTSGSAIMDEAATRPTKETLRLRELVGRAYLMDLAVLGKASDMVVCTVSAMGCRVLAVMMGWENAFEEGGWRNVDGDWSWKGLDW